jgi:hypothetical protein
MKNKYLFHLTIAFSLGILVNIGITYIVRTCKELRYNTSSVIVYHNVNMDKLFKLDSIDPIDWRKYFRSPTTISEIRDYKLRANINGLFFFSKDGDNGSFWITKGLHYPIVERTIKEDNIEETFMNESCRSSITFFYSQDTLIRTHFTCYETDILDKNVTIDQPIMAHTYIDTNGDGFFDLLKLSNGEIICLSTPSSP